MNSKRKRKKQYRYIGVLAIMSCVLLLLSSCKSHGADDKAGEAISIKEKAIERFNEFLSDSSNYPEADADISSIRTALGLIDGDDIPELFICCGSATVDRVHIYSYDSDKDAIDYLGAYSQYGSVIYSEQLNRIQAQYGNNGWFENFIYKINGDKTEIVGRLLANNGIYYADYDDITADEADKVLDRAPGDQYIVSEADYQKRLEEYMCGSDTIRISYDKMTPLEKNISTNNE